MTPFLKAVGLPITMKLELSGSIPGQPQHWNVLFLQLFWREHVGQLTSSLQKKQLSPYGEKQGGKRACSQVNCLQSGSSHLRLECNNPGGFWPGKLLKCYRKRNLFFFFFFFPKPMSFLMPLVHYSSLSVLPVKLKKFLLKMQTCL